MKKIVRILLFSFFLCAFSVFCKALDIEPHVFISSETEYDQYVNENGIPEGFPSYEDLSFLGTFGSFTIPNDDMKTYWYRFDNENGVKLYLRTWTHTPVSWKEVPPPEGDLLKNIYAEQYFAKSGNGFCQCAIDKFTFVYKKSPNSDVILERMHWSNEEGTLHYYLEGFDELDPSKPLIGFLGDLLSAERSETARQQLYDLTVHGKKFEYPPAPAPFPWVWVIIPAGVVLVGGGTAAFFLLRKKKKQ